MNSTNTHNTIFLKDYKKPQCIIKHCDLHFTLNSDKTIVKSVLHLEKIDLYTTSLFLNADELTFVSLFDENQQIPQYLLKDNGIEIDISKFSQKFSLTITNSIEPIKNTQLMGMYISNDRFFTQCEPEGFRRITYFMDRPDVMSTYDVFIIADKSKYPVLLSNGNLIEQKDISDDMHMAHWNDPFPKPSYLFALVAGNLVCNEKFVEFSNGKKQLQIWVEPKDIEKTEHAMNSLIHSIKWDEKEYQRQLDLDRFMIVAVSDFNMGAMENKGLNIFNSKYILATPQTAVDIDYYNIESIIGHEYFHNWTGNRITCRDWFQLSLKEGLTVFRDQSFSASQNENQAEYKIDIERIKNVNLLKQNQFLEDSSPMRHPVQPQLYKEINNFYTSTVYNKGAEVVRMYYTLLGHEGYQKGVQLYFQRHDGQAVTCQDFLQCMMDANNIDLNQFNLWYQQCGTPSVEVKTIYNEDDKTYTLILTQSTPIEPQNKAFFIPFSLGLISQEGNNIDLKLQGSSSINSQKTVTNIVLHFTKATQSFTFENIHNKPIPSLLRGFSAPVNIHYEYTTDELLHILKYDIDSFNRWNACQKLWLMAINPIIEYFTKQFNSVSIDERQIYTTYNIAYDIPLAVKENLEAIIQALYKLTEEYIVEYENDLFKKFDKNEYSDFLALLLTIPSISNIIDYIVLNKQPINPHAIYAARQSVEIIFASQNKNLWKKLYSIIYNKISKDYNYQDYKLRNLQNIALYYACFGDFEYSYLPIEQYKEARHLTNKLASLRSMVRTKNIYLGEYLQNFYDENIDDDLVLDKWFSLNAQYIHRDTVHNLEHINALLAHEKFKLSNPNRVYSVLMVFFYQHPMFHTSMGYEIWQSVILQLDKSNPHLAANIAKAAQQVNIYSHEYKQVFIKIIKDLFISISSKDVKEILEIIIQDSDKK